MATPTFTMRQLMEAGVHFGHRTARWNPKMSPYLFGARNKVHIIDLRQTVPMLHRALSAIRDIVAAGGRVLFVGTKRQASEAIAESASRCGQYYVNHRWLGGMMTNWHTISNSIKRLQVVEEQLEASEATGLTKKELLKLTRERDKLDRALGGIKEMGGLPDILFIVDTNKEEIAVKEAQKLGIPIVAVLDSNSDPDDITYPIPGNDDALRAINLYCELASAAVLDGIQQEMTVKGEDVGEAEEPPLENLAAAEELAAAGEAPKTEPAAEEAAGEAPKTEPAAEEASGEAAEPESSVEATPEPSEAASGPAEPETAPDTPAEVEEKKDEGDSSNSKK
jgi:small subunit ribosomal protein S2